MQKNIFDMTTKRPVRRKEVNKDKWVLTHDLVSYHVVGNVVTEVEFCGVLFKASLPITHRKKK